jgi:uncharacterized protein Yka (UPF0111/DUF47 family)
MYVVNLKDHLEAVQKYKNTDDEKLTKKIKKLVEEADRIDSIED